MELKEESSSMDKLIEKAKRWVQARLSDGDQRPWLEAEPPSSYGNPAYRVRLLVLQGSPPRGLVLANYCLNTVKAMDSQMKRSRTFTYRY